MQAKNDQKIMLENFRLDLNTTTANELIKAALASACFNGET